MTWATDADLDADDTNARGALAAYSEAAVARGDAAVTTCATQRERAYAEILRRLRGRGIAESEISRTDDLVPVESAGALFYLFRAVAQYDETGKKDLFAQRAEYWEARFDQLCASVNPIDGVRSSGGRSVRWGRGS